MMSLRRTGLWLAAAALMGCGSQNEELATSNLMKETASAVAEMAMFWKPKPVPGTVDGEAMAKSALELNKGPLILASFETGYTDIFGMVGENGTMRTYNSPGQRAIILRDGLLAGTRGFGYDVMSTEVGEVGRLIHGRKAGTAQKVARYLDGLGLERPLPLSCTVTPGPMTSYPFIGKTWSGQQVVERCEGHGVSYANSYVVSAQGAILASRQYLMPQVGYLTIQSVRP